MVTAGQETTVERFDFGAGRWNEPGVFVLTGRFTDGSVETRTISFSNRDLVTLELNWENVVSFDLNAAGGVNNAYFAVDNFVFDPPEDEAPLLAATRADGVAEGSGARAASGTRLALTRGTPSGLFNEVEAPGKGFAYLGAPAGGCAPVKNPAFTDGAQEERTPQSASAAFVL